MHAYSLDMLSWNLSVLVLGQLFIEVTDVSGWSPVYAGLLKILAFPPSSLLGRDV